MWSPPPLLSKRPKQLSISWTRWLQSRLWRQLLTGLLVFQLLGFVVWGLLWPKPPPVVLSFVTAESEIVPWRAVIEGFEESHPNIRIHLVTDPEIQTTNQREAIYRADFQADRARYDLVYMDSVWTAQFADQLVDLTPKLQKTEGSSLEGLLDSEIEVGRYGSGLYRLPMRSDVGVLYYRTDLLEQSGQTLASDGAISVDELDSIIKAVKAKTTLDIGYVWQGEAYEGLIANFVETAAGMGGQWIRSEDGKVFPDKAPIIKAATTLQQLIQKELSPLSVTDFTEVDGVEFFLEGKTLFLRGWPYFWSEMQDTKMADKVAIAPPFSFSDAPGVGCRGGWGFGIPQNGAHPDEAWEAIQYFTSEAAQKTFVLASGFLPSRRSLFTDPDIVQKYPLMPQMLDYLDHSSIFRPQLPQYNAASKILQTALSQSLISDDPDVVEAAIVMAQAKTERLLQQSGNALNNGQKDAG